MKRKTIVRSIEKMTLCEYLQSYSVQIWDEIQFARENRLGINETTVTQNMVSDFWRMAKHNVFPIEIYEAKNEKVNGADIEIAVETEKGYVLIACQAKIVKKNDIYSAIRHLVGTTEQIDLLIRYGKNGNRLPLYLFYNYTANYDAREAIEEITGEGTKEIWGCTAGVPEDIRAKFYDDALKKWTLPKFSSLHPQYASPFYWLICSLLNDGSAILPDFFNKAESKIKYYSIEELSKDPYWKDKHPPGQIGFIPTKHAVTQTKVFTNQSDEAFNPRYRIILSRQGRQRGGLYQVS